MSAKRFDQDAQRSPHRVVQRRLARSETPRAISLDDAVRAFVKSNGLTEKVGHFQIYRAWGQALGRDAARRARAVRFARNELVVEVDSAALMAELTGFTGAKYRERANQILGGNTIQKVRFQSKR